VFLVRSTTVEDGRIEMNETKPIPITMMMVRDAFQKVKANKGSAGMDAVDLGSFEENLEDNLYKIWNRLASGSYFPPPVKKVLIPKPNGKMRVLGVPTIGDRVAQMVVKNHLEPMLEPHFHGSSYGYRPRRSAHDALGAALANSRKLPWVLDLDISAFFDTINHGLLMTALERHTQDKWVLMYAERWLKAPMMDTGGNIERRDKGTPQGGVISPLLANLFLHYVFDKWMDIHHNGEALFERYADDIIVHCGSLNHAQSLLRGIQARLETCGLQLNVEKTHIACCKQQKGAANHPEVSFKFLGHTFKPMRNRDKKGQYFSGFGCEASKDAIKAISLGIRRLKVHRWTTESLESIAEKLNPRMRGWINYFLKYGKRSLSGFLYRLNNMLIRWVQNRYKRLRGSFWRAHRWLAEKASVNPNLFAHWTVGYRPKLR
jgi:RNA-directed DNA polymerase